ncbi:MAG TPA: hypothetical protein VGY58_02900 [Gemmataceae bacterium]|nr:hypothetical protein [Gemmataceae bacterium]
MNLPLLFAEMNAVKVLSIIHWIGVVFIFLWFLGSCMKDGMWNNALRCFNAYVAAFGSILLGGLIFGIVMAAGVAPSGGTPEDMYITAGILFGSLWVGFLIGLAVLQTITDRLSSVKVAFHPVVNSIGSFIFVCGITFVLMCFCTPIYLIVQIAK